MKNTSVELHPDNHNCHNGKQGENAEQQPGIGAPACFAVGLGIQDYLSELLSQRSSLRALPDSPPGRL
jgi:hypothetical protein